MESLSFQATQKTEHQPTSKNRVATRDGSRSTGSNNSYWKSIPGDKGREAILPILTKYEAVAGSITDKPIPLATISQIDVDHWASATM